MRRFKKLVPFVLIFTLIFGLYGCGTKSPTNTVKDYLEEIKKGENGDFSNLVNETLDKDKKKAAEKSNDEITKKLIDSMKNITYTINSENIDGNNAKVNVKIKGPDIGTVMVEYIQKGMTIAFSQAFSDKQPTKEESDKLYEKIFLECMNNVKYTERTGDISLTKVEGKWKINKDNSIVKLLMNIDDSLLNSNSKEDKTTKKKIQDMTLNKPFTVETANGKYTLTIEGARLTDKRNEFSEKKINKVVMLDYSYANESFGGKEGIDLYIDANAFQVLDDEGNVLDTYPVSDENRTPQAAPVGGKSKGTIAYGLTTNSKSLKVTFVRGNEKISKITIPIK